MTIYQKMIQEVTGCQISEVAFVEDVMRNDVVKTTLDNISRTEFNRAAVESYSLYKEFKVMGLYDASLEELIAML